MLKTRFHVFLILLTLIVILPFLLNAQYAVAVLDDYAYSMRDMHSAWWQSVFETYRDFSGRYFATLLSRLNPLEFSSSFNYFSLYSICLLLFMWLSAWLALWSHTRKVLRWYERCALSGLFCVLYLSLCPSIAQAFYWFSSYTAYTVVLILVFLFISLLGNRCFLSVILKCVLAVSIVGSNEVSAVLFVVSLLFYAHVHRASLEKSSYLVLAVALLSFLLVVFCPGNAVRMDNGLSHSPLLWALVVTPLQTIGWFVLWLPVVGLFAICYIYIYGTRVSELPLFNVSSVKTALCFVVAVLLAHVPCTVGLSTVVIGRTANALLFFFLLWSFYFIHVLMHHHSEKVKAWVQQPLSRWVAYVSLVAAIMLVVFRLEGNVVSAYVDYFSGQSAAYQHEMRLRCVQAESAQGQKLLFQPIKHQSQTLYIGDLSTDTADLRNVNFARFFHLQSVALTAEPSTENTTFERLKNLVKKQR